MSTGNAIAGNRRHSSRSRASIVKTVGLGLLLLVTSGPAAESGPGEAMPRTTIAFRDIGDEAGLHFRFDNGSRGKHDLPEIMGGGVALIDADGDSRLDVYLCNGGPIVPEAGVLDPPCQLFLNAGNGQFRDCTELSGAPGPRYAMGAAVGDVDNDGRDDLFVTGWRDQRLYRNLGGGRFEDVTERSGVVSNLWSTSAAFADLDNDGDLDLYVCNYLDYDASLAPFCSAPDGRRDYCGPELFPAQTDRLYRNNGDGTFTDIAREAGVALPDGRGLGVLIADMTGDGRLDLFIANDGTACRLFENRGNLRFQDVALKAGVAFDGKGEPLAAMGIARGDFDDDGRPDLLVANFFGRSTVGFRSLGGGAYADVSAAIGLTSATRNVLGFGLSLTDRAGDGGLALLHANGHVLDRARLGVPFAMPPLLLQNENGRFRDVSRTAGPWFTKPILGRGVAIGDLDGDGRPDAIVNAIDAPAALLRNVSTGGPILALELVGRPPASREAIGAKIRATVGGRVQTREVFGGGSYLSASSRTLFLGLGGAKQVDRLEVSWPSGRIEQWKGLEPGKVIQLEEGTGSSPGFRE